jgi:hypothetical protein
MDWLAVLAQTCERSNWVVHVYCQMTNHFHLLLETIDGNLSRGMRQLNVRIIKTVDIRMLDLTLFFVCLRPGFLCDEYRMAATLAWTGPYRA